MISCAHRRGGVYEWRESREEEADREPHETERAAEAQHRRLMTKS